MGVESDAREVVERIAQEVQSARGTRIWEDFINALNLISQVVFTRSSGFILELMQNAEDAGLLSSEPGFFKIRLSKAGMIVQHNGSPFTPNDVASICGIRSSKKPERGTLGYLGIGFKSVFKVTDCPRIYSQDYRFEFDRSAWPDPANTPWHIIPLWIQEDQDGREKDLTTFDIPFRDDSTYSTLREEVRSVRTELFLFLKWLKKIEIVDEPSGESWMLENLGEDKDGITTLTQGGQKQRFKFFRRTISVPDHVKDDRLTQQYRANVTQREIAIAFALDSLGNLSPSRAGAMYGGVYSFIPLGEASSGAKFPIQADFLVQPGRDAINYEAAWNHWLLREVAELCKVAVAAFKASDRWRFQFLPSFDFSRSVGQDSFEKLFGPRLIGPVEEFITTDRCIPANDGGWTSHNQAIRLSEDTRARDELVKHGILSMSDVPAVMGGDQSLIVVDPRTRHSELRPIRSVDRRDLLRNLAFLKLKAAANDGAMWFRILYHWIAENPVRNVTQSYKEHRVTNETFTEVWQPQDGRTYRYVFEAYHDYEFILDADRTLHRGGAVHLPELTSTDALLADVAMDLQKTRPILHPTVLAAPNPQERNRIRSFLTGRAGVQILDTQRVCREAILPKIRSSASKPDARTLVQLTRWCVQYLEPNAVSGSELWVLAKRSGVRRAREVVFGLEYLTGQDWESRRHLVPGLTILGSQYIPKNASPAQVAKFSNFLKEGGVREAPDNGVEDFAVSYAIQELKSSGIRAKRVEKRNFGYDLQVSGKSGKRMRIEVKGQTQEKDVELTGNEADSADKYKGEFYLAVVPGIPNTPSLYVLNNPVAVGKKDKLLIEIPKWKSKKW